MTNRIAIAISVALLLPTPLSAAWTLAPCPAERAKDWQAYERTIRAAEPGSPHYLPKPYPRSVQEVIEDYLYQYRTRARDAASLADLFVGEREVLDGVQRNTLRFEVVRVENWTTMRCGKRGELTFYHLLRIFSAADRTELGRTVLADSGFIAVELFTTARERASPAPEQQRRLMGLEAALAKARGEFGVVGTAPQYVFTFGTLRCPSEAPCVAFRAGADAYILSERDGLFEIAAARRRLSTEKELKGPARMAMPEILGLTPDERLVSLGGTVFAVARQVDRRPNP